MRKRLTIGLVAAVAFVGLVVARGHDVMRFAVEQGAGLASGYGVRIADMRFAGDEATLVNVHVERAGEPVLDVGRVAIRYSLRDLLPGSRHRFGLVGVELSDAKLTISRFRDGTYNLNLPSAAAPGVPLAPRINPVPIRFWLRVHGARLELREPNAYDASAKDVRVRDVDVDATIDTAAVTQYRVTGAFAERRDEPFTLAGKIDAVRGYASHHARAARFPLRALSNYFAYTPAVRILKGGARNFDARLYSLDVQPDISPSYHVSLRLDVDGGRLALASLALPLDGVRGRLQVVDNAFFIQDLRATLAGIPLRVTGGVYDLTGTLTGRPQLRLGVSGTGDLRALRRAFTFTRDQPISGRTQLGVLVVGPIDDPLIVAQANAPHAFYRSLPFDALHAGVAYHANVITLAPLHAYYGGTDVGIRGTMQIGAHLHSRFAVHVAGSASRLPYLDEMLGDEPIVIDASAIGSDLLFHVDGAVASAKGVARMAALLEMNPNGTASVDPFWFHTERGDFDGGYILDRPHATSAFWAIANNLRMRAPSYKAFPGISLPQMPRVDSRRIAMTMAGGGSAPNIVLAGIVTGGETNIAGVQFHRIEAAFGGTLQNAAVNRLHAAGPWGTFSGHGDFSSARFVAYGKYRGTFEGLQPFLGNAITGHGGLAGTVAVGVEPERILVQGTHLAMRNATLRGIPLNDASITLAVEGDRLRVYSAHTQAADGDVVAAGTFSLAGPARTRNADALSLVANHLAAAQLRGIGLPLDAGRLSATGDLAAGAPLPEFNGGVTVANGRMAHFAIAGGGDVKLGGDAASLGRMVGAVGTTYARVDGSIGSLSSGSPAYALDAEVPAARIASALHAFGFQNYATDGTFNARLRIGGHSLSPTVAGHIGVPAGEVNGLPFIDGSAALAAGTNGVSVQHGQVLVGTTHAQFSAVAVPHEQAVHVDAAHADLSDFNNFFDTGDTLDGDGRVKFAADVRGTRLTSSGDIDVRAFRYRNLPIGDTRASWSSARNVINGSLAIGGSEGMLHAHGSIAPEPEQAWQSTLEHTRFDLAAQVNDLDLSLWMPALGLQSLPITGRASGEATVRGQFPLLNVNGNAGITGGTLGPLTLESAQLAVHSAGRRVAIDRAEITTPELSASASGSLGFGNDTPLDVSVHAATDKLAELVYDVSRMRVPVMGSFESTLQIGGTYKSPTLLAGFDGADVKAYGIPISALFGEMRLHGRTLVLSDAGATFQHGEATLAGSLPLQLSPLRLAAPDQPISFDLDVVDLNPTIFETILGNNTKLSGLVNGHIGLSGTIREPVIVGHASLANGSYVSDLQRIPITRTVAALSFNRTSASIDRLSASMGTGSVQGSGRLEFPGGFSASAPSLVVNASARGAQLDLPAYGSGTLDAHVAITKDPKADALLSGSVTLSNATLPFATFIKAAQQSSAAGLPALPLAFDLRATAGKNVRVRGNGYGAGLDIGTTGSVQLGGTLASPTLSGSFSSTGGTLTYFDRAFRVQQGVVRFNPADGVLPTLHAVATSNVVNPDPDRARNPYGSATVTITVDGPIEGLKIGFTTDPPGYSRDQIIGLIAPFGGFVNGIAFSRQSMLQAQSPNGVTPLGAVSPIPNVSLGQNSSISVGQEAFNLLNAQFTAGLLAPFESSLGQGLGLSSVNLTLGYYGNVGLTATRLLGKTVSAVYAVTFGIPQIQSFGLQLQPSQTTTATLSFFLRSGPINLVQSPGTPLGYGGYLLGQPLVGNSGFSLTGQHYFW